MFIDQNFCRSDWESQDSNVTPQEDTSSSTTISSQNTKWSLECSTTEEWSNLVETMMDSKHVDENALYAVLSEQFMEKIPQRIEAKVTLLDLFA